MKSQEPVDSFSTHPKHGAALIVTLLVLVLLVVIVTGFLSTTRVEQMASRNFTYQAQAQQMAMAGIQQALAQLNKSFPTNTANITNFTTQPGLILSNGQSFYLSSASVSNASSDRINLNESKIIHTNTFDSNTHIYWPPLVLISNASSNPIGRYAYWIDDEGTKANLNAMDPNQRASFLPTNERSYSYSAIGAAGLTNFQTAITNGNSNSWAYFFTASQLGLLIKANTNAIEYGHSMAGGPGNLTNPLAFMTNGYLNINSSTEGGLFTNRLAANVVTTNINFIITNSIDRTFIKNKFHSSFTNKYGIDVLRQIVANINDRPLPFNTNVATGAGDLNSDGIPNRVLGLRPFLHLNEISLAAAWATNATDIQGQLLIQIELVNPYSITNNIGAGSDIVVILDPNTFAGTYDVDGAPNTPFNVTFSSVNIPGVNVPHGSYGVVSNIWQNNVNPPPSGNFSNVQITNFPKIKAVKLRREATDQTIQDWAISFDFTNNGTDINFSTNQVSQGAFGSSPTNSRGIAKNDPRVRTFPSWISPTPTELGAWSPVGGTNANPLTLGSFNTNIVTFIGHAGKINIGKDPGAGTTNISDHPSFKETVNLTTNFSPYTTILQLGFVHTGLQWRTLQMRAQDPIEGTNIPDWALLEAFYVSNNVIIPKININSVQQQANTNSTISMSISNQAITNILRVRSLASLLTNAGTPTVINFDASSKITNTNVLMIASNILQLKFNTNWISKRSGHGFSSSNTFYSIGEVLEISNVSDFSPSDYINEGRAAAFMDAITIASDTFMIYSYGEAVDASTNAVAEYRCKALVKYNNAEGKFEIITVEPMPLP